MTLTRTYITPKGYKYLFNYTKSRDNKDRLIDVWYINPKGSLLRYKKSSLGNILFAIRTKAITRTITN